MIDLRLAVSCMYSSSPSWYSEAMSSLSPIHYASMPELGNSGSWW